MSSRAAACERASSTGRRFNEPHSSAYFAPSSEVRTAALVTATVPKNLYAVGVADLLGHLDGVLPS